MTCKAKLARQGPRNPDAQSEKAGGNEVVGVPGEGALGAAAASKGVKTPAAAEDDWPSLEGPAEVDGTPAPTIIAGLAKEWPRDW